MFLGRGCCPPHQLGRGHGGALSSCSVVRGKAATTWQFRTLYIGSKGAPGVDFTDIKFLSVKSSRGSEVQKTQQPDFCGSVDENSLIANSTCRKLFQFTRAH